MSYFKIYISCFVFLVLPVFYSSADMSCLSCRQGDLKDLIKPGTITKANAESLTGDVGATTAKLNAEIDVAKECKTLATTCKSYCLTIWFIRKGETTAVALRTCDVLVIGDGKTAVDAISATSTNADIATAFDSYILASSGLAIGGFSKCYTEKCNKAPITVYHCANCHFSTGINRESLLDEQSSKLTKIPKCDSSQIQTCDTFSDKCLEVFASDHEMTTYGESILHVKSCPSVFATGKLVCNDVKVNNLTKSDFYKETLSKASAGYSQCCSGNDCNNGLTFLSAIGVKRTLDVHLTNPTTTITTTPTTTTTKSAGKDSKKNLVSVSLTGFMITLSLMIKLY